MEVVTNLTVIIISQYIYIYVHQIITLYTLNLHNAIGQLQFNKAWGWGRVGH